MQSSILTSKFDVYAMLSNQAYCTCRQSTGTLRTVSNMLNVLHFTGIQYMRKYFNAKYRPRPQKNFIFDSYVLEFLT